MSISISEMYISRQDDRYEIDVNNTKNKMQQAKKQYSSLLSSDTAVISEEGRKALQNKMSAFAKTGGDYPLLALLVIVMIMKRYYQNYPMVAFRMSL